MTKLALSTKADTLQSLTPFLKKSKIEKSFSFTISEWKNNQQDILNKIKQEFSPAKIVVRSSAIAEDTSECSLAGCFESVLNVDSKNIQEISLSIKRVINSYKHKGAESSFNQILIQSQTKDISMSGVIFTRGQHNSPYYVINYDNITGSTESVTKGLENKTIKIFKYIKDNRLPNQLKNILAAVKEIEEKFSNKDLDIEFAINKQGEIIIFQVRPLTIIKNSNIKDIIIKEKIERLKEHFRNLSLRKSHLSGRGIFGDMPDWNPAEIIGDNPNHLDFSLYDYIITESSWHKARTSQGYFDVSPARLVVLFGNKPYVDVKSSFNSFTPASISKSLRSKLVDFYLNKLKKNPEAQDKVEFEILYTCYDLCFDKKSEELSKANFSKQEIEELKKALLNLTNNLIINYKKLIKEDMDSIQEMINNRKKIKIKQEEYVSSPLACAKLLLDDCREKATIQFSRLARLGFIGKIILKSLIDKKIINENFVDLFMNSITTIATEFKKDFYLMSKNKIKKQIFMQKYYHLRPNSYDITSLRYELDSNIFNIKNFSKHFKKPKKFNLTVKMQEKITKELTTNGLKFDAKTLFNFIEESLAARELSKFEFTKNLSDAIELIAIAGSQMGFSREEMATLSIRELFKNNIKNRAHLASNLAEIISERKKQRLLNQKLELPPIIFSEDDFDIVKFYTPKPNFITQKKVKAKIINLERQKINENEIKDKIIVLENGDPGYDWIFTRNPAGLITKFGGVASHMAIRCAEFGLPAAIGCGVLFDKIKNKHEILLDCKFKKIETLN